MSIMPNRNWRTTRHFSCFPPYDPTKATRRNPPVETINSQRSQTYESATATCDCPGAMILFKKSVLLHVIDLAIFLRRSPPAPTSHSIQGEDNVRPCVREKRTRVVHFTFNRVSLQGFVTGNQVDREDNVGESVARESCAVSICDVEDEQERV